MIKIKIENGYLVFENEILKNKKIGGHAFVGLNNLDHFKRVGDVLLSLFGILKEEVDEKYLKRGDYAENIIKYVYERDGHKCTTYDKKEIRYDNFKEYVNCGGLIDIELLEESTLIEVKSKSLKDYDYISKVGMPNSEIYQGMYYGYLRKYNSIKMEYVFFDKETEEEIFNSKKPTTLKNLKRLSKTYDVNRQEIENMIKNAIKLKTIAFNERKISVDLISDNALKKLNLFQEKINKDFAEVPF